MLQGGGEECLAWKEEDDELRGGAGPKLLPVGLPCERLHVAAEVSSVGAEQSCAFAWICRCTGVEIGAKGRLGVNDDGALAGEPHDHIRPQSTRFTVVGLSVDRDLRLEVAVRCHARQLHHAPQLQLAPPTARTRCPECR